MVTATYDSPSTRRNPQRSAARLLTETDDDATLLPYGYTPAKVERLVWVAAWRHTFGLDEQDAYEAAWGGIIERLYTPEAGPPANDGHLIAYARTEMQRVSALNWRVKGVPSHDPMGKPATARGFRRYWDDYTIRSAPARTVQTDARDHLLVTGGTVVTGAADP